MLSYQMKIQLVFMNTCMRFFTGIRTMATAKKGMAITTEISGIHWYYLCSRCKLGRAELAGHPKYENKSGESVHKSKGQLQ